MNSVMRFIVWGTIPIGAARGRSARHLDRSARDASSSGAIGGSLAILWIVFSPQRHLREMPEPIEDEPRTTSSAPDVRGSRIRSRPRQTAPDDAHLADRRSLAPRATSCKLWSAETVSQLGTQVSQLALPLAAILVLDASAFEVALLGALAVPSVPALHAAGRRLGRPATAPARSSSPATSAARLAARVGPDRVRGRRPHDLAALRRRLRRRGRHGLLRRRLPVLPAVARRQDQLVDGNSKLEISRAGAFIAGPGPRRRPRRRDHGPGRDPGRRRELPGLRPGSSPASVAKEERPERHPDAHLGRELWEGLRYLATHRYWRPFAMCTATSNFFGQVVGSIFLVYAVRELDLSPQLIGLTLVPVGVGGIVAAAPRGAGLEAVRRRPDDHRRGRASSACDAPHPARAYVLPAPVPAPGVRARSARAGSPTTSRASASCSR